MTARTGRFPVFVYASVLAHALLLGQAGQESARNTPAFPGQPAISVALIDSTAGKHASADDHVPAPKRDAGAAARAERTTDTDDGRANPSPATGEAMNQLLGELRTRLSEYLTYPLLARRRGWEGTVDLHVRIHADGHVDDVHLARSSGYDVLDRSALGAMRQVRQVGASLAWLQRGNIEMQLPINFTLDGIHHGPPTL